MANQVSQLSFLSISDFLTFSYFQHEAVDALFVTPGTVLSISCGAD